MKKNALLPSALAVTMPESASLEPVEISSTVPSSHSYASAWLFVSRSASGSDEVKKTRPSSLRLSPCGVRNVSVVGSACGGRTGGAVERVRVGVVAVYL